MAVNEAPRLTLGVTIGLMFVMLMLCFVADDFKCRKGKSSGCLGQATYRCDEPFCHDRVAGLTSAKSGAACGGEGRPTLLLHVVEVASSSPADRIAHSETSTLSKSLEQSLRRAAGGSGEAWLKTHLDALAALKRRLGATVHVGSDRVTFPFPDDTNMWLNDLGARLPRDARSSNTAVKDHFPHLFRQLSDVIKQREAAGKEPFASDNTGCHALHLVVVTVIHPGTAVSTWVDTDRSPEAAVEQLQRGHYHIRHVLSEYLSNKRLFAKYLNAVDFVTMPVLFPAHNFTFDIAENVPRSALTAIPDDLSGCGDWGLCEGPAASTCCESCSVLQGQGLRARQVSTAQMAWHAAQDPRRRYANTVHAPYKDCYYGARAMLNTSIPSHESVLFADCLRLTDPGLEKLSDCLTMATVQ